MEHAVSQMSLQAATILAGFAGIAVVVGLWPLLRMLRTRQILDLPNQRSSHETPTPKGAGLVVIPVICLTWSGANLWYELGSAMEVMIVVLAALMIGAVSWIDDLKGLSAKKRLLVHLVCVLVTIGFMEGGIVTVSNLALFALTVLLWVWFINLFNFMDGIDGLSGVNGLTVAAGMAVVLVSDNGSMTLIAYAMVVAGCSLGFLVWNWSPAKIFLGDVGSAPMGFLIAWLMYELAMEGYVTAAVLLPGYYLADASLTLLKRVWRREDVTKAHRQHSYQCAIKRGLSHRNVCIVIFLLNVCLVGLSVAASRLETVLVIIPGVALIGGTLLYLKGIGIHGSSTIES